MCVGGVRACLCVCVCRGVLCGGCNLSVCGFIIVYDRGHQRGGAREKRPVEREEKVCARERSRHRENVFVRETPRKTTIYRWCM